MASTVKVNIHVSIIPVKDNIERNNKIYVKVQSHSWYKLLFCYFLSNGVSKCFEVSVSD